MTLENKFANIHVDARKQFSITERESEELLMTKKNPEKKSKKSFQDYLEFRVLLLNNGIKNLKEFAEFMGYRPASVSEKFSGNRKWKLEDLMYMSDKFKVPIDELVKLLKVVS